MRELNLYQQNIQLLAKVLLLDAMLYENPWKSLYLFCGAMYCVTFNTVAMVPAFVVGYILILYVENYWHFVENKDFHLGYKPLTIVEVFKALILNKDGKYDKQMVFEPIAVEKRAKRRHGNAAAQRPRRRSSNEETNLVDGAEDDGGDIVPMDHREFIFADRDAYPKFSVEDSIAPGSSKGTCEKQIVAECCQQTSQTRLCRNRWDGTPPWTAFGILLRRGSNCCRFRKRW